ncbi:unnamed protein product [Euphydryas editha]|uniref:Histone H3 n=1 Tax=Euphydryas editha TaxID=104508 RepID=A0AAU9TD82_EUPED|nr:unnamed protein product [Euphydryas editha]
MRGGAARAPLDARLSQATPPANRSRRTRAPKVRYAKLRRPLAARSPARRFHILQRDTDPSSIGGQSTSAGVSKQGSAG